MSTANQIVQEALELVGAYSPLKPARPEIINRAFILLQRYLLWLEARSILLTGIVYPTVIGDQLSEPDDATDFLINNLAVKIAPFLQKEASLTVKGKAKGSFQMIYNTYGPKPKEIRKATLPLGSGNKTEFSNPNFYPEAYETDE